jgi:Beta-lactamase enzyme family
MRRWYALACTLTAAIVLGFIPVPRPHSADAQPLPADPVARALAEIGALPGKTSVLITENGRELGALNADTPLGVGSSFKMAVLLTLRRQIEAGRHSWTEVVPLRPEWRVPGGVPLANWADGSPFTVETYAGFMISKSDNTGTDAVMGIVGRENIEQFTGRNRPLLNTRDLYIFKSTLSRDLLERWRTGDEAQRRALLASMATMPVPTEGFLDVPYALDVEWFFSNRELCGLIEQVADLPVMGIESPLAPKEDWARVAFKGGSEPGVISMTTRVQAADGRTYCVSATWNNDQTVVDPPTLAAIQTRLFKALKDR